MTVSLLLAIPFALSPSSGTAQTEHQTSRLRIAAIYMILGGVTGAAGRAATHRSAWKGFLEGATGGAIAFGGKCMIAQSTSFTDWTGRGTVAVGSSIIANTLLKRSTLQSFTLPLGPIMVEHDFKTGNDKARLALVPAVFAGYMLVMPSYSFLGRETLRHAALSFEYPSAPYDQSGVGILLLRPGVERYGITHELIHVSQNDFIDIAWGLPLQERIAKRVPFVKRLNTNFDLDVLSPFWGVISTSGKVWDRPSEHEARSLTTKC